MTFALVGGIMCIIFSGEYIDIQFDQKKPQKDQSPKAVRSGSDSWQRKKSEPAVPVMGSTGDAGNTSAPGMREHDYEEVGDEEHYAMMSPTDGKDRAPKLSSSLHKITCPLSLDDPALDTLQPKATPNPACVSDLMSSLSVESDKMIKMPQGSGSTQPHIQTTPPPTVIPPFSHSNPVSPAATSGSGVDTGDDDDSNYFNLDLSSVSAGSGTGNKKTTKESVSPSKLAGGTKQKAAKKLEHSSIAGGSSRKHSSSPLATLLQGLSQGRKSPKHKGSSSPKHSVSDETAAYSEMSFLPPSSSPKVNRRRSESASPIPPSQFTKNPPHSTATVKPSAVHTSATGESTSQKNKSAVQDSTSNTAAMRSIKSTGSLTAMDVSSTQTSKIHVTSPKILLTSTELINEISATSTASGSINANRRSGNWQDSSPSAKFYQDLSCSAYENLSFENNKPLRQSSHTSVGSNTSGEPELHYAALDLSSSVEDIIPIAGIEQKSPGNKSRHTSGSVVTNSTNGNGGVGGGCIDEEMPLQYAQIDFVKSESLRTNSTPQSGGNNVSSNMGITQKETQIPFEVANMNLQTTWTPPSTNDSPPTKKTQAPFDLG